MVIEISQPEKPIIFYIDVFIQSYPTPLFISFHTFILPFQISNRTAIKKLPWHWNRERIGVKYPLNPMKITCPLLATTKQSLEYFPNKLNRFTKYTYAQDRKIKREGRKTSTPPSKPTLTCSKPMHIQQFKIYILPKLLY